MTMTWPVKHKILHYILALLVLPHSNSSSSQWNWNHALVLYRIPTNLRKQWEREREKKEIIPISIIQHASSLTPHDRSYPLRNSLQNFKVKRGERQSLIIWDIVSSNLLNLINFKMHLYDQEKSKFDHYI